MGFVWCPFPLRRMTGREQRGGNRIIIGGGPKPFLGRGFMVCFPLPISSPPPWFFSDTVVYQTSWNKGRYTTSFADLFFTQISGRNFLPELCGEVHPETTPLQALLPATPPPLVQKRDALHKFLQHRGHTPILVLISRCFCLLRVAILRF